MTESVCEVDNRGTGHGHGNTDVCVVAHTPSEQEETWPAAVRKVLRKPNTAPLLCEWRRVAYDATGPADVHRVDNGSYAGTLPAVEPPKRMRAY